MAFDFDVINWLFGRPNEIHAAATTMENGTPSHVVATLQYDDFIATVKASGIMPVGFPFSVGLRVVGERGMLETGGKFVDDVPQGSFVHYGEEARRSTTRAVTRMRQNAVSLWIACSATPTPNC